MQSRYINADEMVLCFGESGGMQSFALDAAAGSTERS